VAAGIIATAHLGGARVVVGPAARALRFVGTAVAGETASRDNTLIGGVILHGGCRKHQGAMTVIARHDCRDMT